MFTRAIVRPPAPNFSEGLTTSGLGAPLYERAVRQHEAYCAALEQCGLSLTRLDVDLDYPDSTFVEDAAVLTEKCAVLTRPGARSRRGEVPVIRTALEDFFPASVVHTIQAPGTLDGGDVCEADDSFFIGISERTNETGAQQLAEILALCGYSSRLVDIRNTPGLLHLKSGLAYLGGNRLVVTGSLAEGTGFSKYDLVRVNTHEEYAANCVHINDRVLVASGFPVLERTLRQLGYRITILEMSEFQKMDGGLSCLSLRF